MPAPTRPVAEAPPAGAAGGGLPFLVGSNMYQEAPFNAFTQTLDGNPHENPVSITPGGFLRGVTLQVTSASGVLGTTAALAGDSPWSMFSNIQLEDISGGPILFPMSGFSHFLAQKYLRPWDGDPTKRSDFSNTINPAFTLRLMVEVKDTLAVLANTDARAQYRLRYTLAPLVQSGQFGLVSVSTGVTAPAVTVKSYIETWAQPDLHDLLGESIGQVPEGIIASRFLMHEVPAFNAGTNTIRATLVGNELRGLVIVIRNGDANKTRVNLTDNNAGAIDLRLDNRRLWKRNQSQWVEEMQAFYPLLGAGTLTREAGVYTIPRFSGQPSPGDPSAGQGEYWLQTVEQTLLQFELAGTDLANPPGSFEIIYDSLAIAGTLPPDLEGM